MNEKHSHTPGPWQVMARTFPERSCNPLYSVICRRDDERKESIVCNSCDLSDAHLIAAAPELLAALKDSLNAPFPDDMALLIQGIGGKSETISAAMGLIKDWKERQERARAALLKAGGAE